ncbi:telomerase reverse transcriptase isoform X4 [Eurytemora carolleeae]|uniref:telomerase reverse transcriptase isoform X4 n=1 Tax=Eurytemora carolleeae TaxID=1294199 RepID=UPI000C7669E7|nr:telomerase reverse transcriptase isoform X4 [Eurytemora carolleeae]|eukprot:XP_023344926.1 telomerase reverse transcriptase-like isoform X4 [Eurytemora affinis]
MEIRFTQLQNNESHLVTQTGRILENVATRPISILQGVANKPTRILQAVPPKDGVNYHDQSVKQLSKNRKRRERRKLAKLKNQNQEPIEKRTAHKPSLKFKSPIVRKLNLHKNCFRERISPHFIYNSSEIVNCFKFVEEILAMQVGVEFLSGREVLFSKPFLLPLQAVFERLQKVSMKALVDHHCPRVVGATELIKIITLLRSVLHKIGIQKLVGTTRNKRMLMRSISLFLNSPKNMEIPLGTLLQGFQITEVPWLTGVDKSLSLNLLAKLVKWILTRLVESIVRGFFKLTDASHGKQKIFYFRKSAWQSIVFSGLAELKRSSKYLPISSSKLHVLQSKSVVPPSISILRFIPKKSLAGVRPICIVEKKVMDETQMMKVVLKPIALKITPGLQNTGNMLHNLWSEFSSALLPVPEVPVYWVVVDISDAYGSIDLRKLSQILEEYKSPENKKEIERIQQRLFLHVLKFPVGKSHLRFLVRKGILQGDVLSPLLSNIYYGHMTQHCLTEFIRSPLKEKEIFLRGADDFLFVSTNKDRAQAFLNKTALGFPEYHCRLNVKKTQSNLLDPTIIQFTFCGSNVNIESRSVEPNLDSFSNTNIGFAMQWPELCKPVGSTVFSKFQYFCGRYLVPLYFNTNNPLNTSLTSLAAIIFIALKRLTCLLDVLIASRGGQVKESWIWRVLMAGLRRFNVVARMR